MEGEEDIPESFLSRIGKRMEELWNARDEGNAPELFALAQESFDQRARNALAREYRLDADTVDDCVGEAVEALLKVWRQDPGRVRSPCSWLWGTAKNLCRVLVRAAIKKRGDAGQQVEFDDDIAENVPDAVATTWLEELGDIELPPDIEREWVRDVMLAAVNGLTPALKAVALEMLREDAGALVDPAEAIARLGITAATWRQNKKRALEALRVSIPELIGIMGISLTRREEQSLFKHRNRDLDEADAGEDGPEA